MEKINSNKVARRIILRIISILLPVYLIWWCFIEFFPMQYASQTAVRWYYLKERLEPANLPQTDNLLLGDSRLNAGVKVCDLPQSYSFASGGSTSIEMYYVLKKYIDAGGKPKRVFISISPRFFTEKFIFWHYAARSGFINFSDISEIGSAARNFPNDSLFSFMPEAKYLLYRLNYPGYYQYDVRKIYTLDRHKRNMQLLDIMKNSCGNRPHTGLKDSCNELNYETRFKIFEPSQILNYYFIKILELCKENKFETIFLCCPMNESSFNALSNNFKNSYKAYFDNIQMQYPEFELSNTIYSYPDSLFGDASHLNEKGQAKYTEFLLKTYFYQDSLEFICF